MVTSVVAVATAAHDAQRCGHGALARGQDRADQQQKETRQGWMVMVGFTASALVLPGERANGQPVEAVHLGDGF